MDVVSFVVGFFGGAALVFVITQVYIVCLKERHEALRKQNLLLKRTYVYPTSGELGAASATFDAEFEDSYNQSSPILERVRDGL